MGLGYLLQRPGGLQAMEDWADSLSLGEQQRLAFARLFCHDPAFAIIDVSGRHCFKRRILYSRTSSLRYDAPGEPGVSCDSCGLARLRRRAPVPWTWRWRSTVSGGASRGASAWCLWATDPP